MSTWKKAKATLGRAVVLFTWMVSGAILFSNHSLSAPCSFQSLPSDFSEDYQNLFLFTSSLKVRSLQGIDECLRGAPESFPWVLTCDEKGQFLEARASVFLWPKLELVFNADRELQVNLQLQDQWDYSKVSPSEVAQTIIRAGKEARLIFTTTSARKVHLSFVTNSKVSELIQLELLVYKMAIGKPVLEAKYSCENL